MSSPSSPLNIVHNGPLAGLEIWQFRMTLRLSGGPRPIHGGRIITPSECPLGSDQMAVDEAHPNDTYCCLTIAKLVLLQ